MYLKISKMFLYLKKHIKDVQDESVQFLKMNRVIKRERAMGINDVVADIKAAHLNWSSIASLLPNSLTRFKFAVSSTKYK